MPEAVRKRLPCVGDRRSISWLLLALSDTPITWLHKAIAICRIRAANSVFCARVVSIWRCMAAIRSSIVETRSFTPAGLFVSGAIAAAEAWAL